MELESLKETGLFEGQDIALKLQELYINESNESPSRGTQAQAAFNITGKLLYIQNLAERVACAKIA